MYVYFIYDLDSIQNWEIKTNFQKSKLIILCIVIEFGNILRISCRLRFMGLVRRQGMQFSITYLIR